MSPRLSRARSISYDDDTGTKHVDPLNRSNRLHRVTSERPSIAFEYNEPVTEESPARVAFHRKKSNRPPVSRFRQEEVKTSVDEIIGQSKQHESTQPPILRLRNSRPPLVRNQSYRARDPATTVIPDSTQRSFNRKLAKLNTNSPNRRSFNRKPSIVTTTPSSIRTTKKYFKSSNRKTYPTTTYNPPEATEAVAPTRNFRNRQTFGRPKPKYDDEVQEDNYPEHFKLLIKQKLDHLTDEDADPTTEKVYSKAASHRATTRPTFPSKRLKMTPLPGRFTTAVDSNKERLIHPAIRPTFAAKTREGPKVNFPPLKKKITTTTQATTTTEKPEYEATLEEDNDENLILEEDYEDAQLTKSKYEGFTSRYEQETFGPLANEREPRTKERGYDRFKEDYFDKDTDLQNEKRFIPTHPVRVLILLVLII